MADSDSPKDTVRRGYDQLSVLYRTDDGTSEDYERLIGELLRRLPERAGVLELGCGAGVPVARELARAGCSVLGVDFSEVQIERARRLVPDAEFLCEDITGLRLSGRWFDAVVSLFALIHVPLAEQRALISRLVRWIRPGGTLLLTAGHDAWEGSETGWLGGLAEMWWSHADRATYREWLEGAGLVEIEEGFIPEGDSGHSVFWARRPSESADHPWCQDSGTRAVEFLADLGIEAAHHHEPEWADGTLSVSLFLTGQPPPDDLASSIRCVVLDHERVLVCETPNDKHIVPGGRRELGESWEETARREVLEETGFRVGALSQVAVVQLHRDGERPDDPAFTYPHPDAFWVIYRGEPLGRSREDWTDTDGWESGSELVPFDAAFEALGGGPWSLLLRSLI